MFCGTLCKHSVLPRFWRWVSNDSPKIYENKVKVQGFNINYVRSGNGTKSLLLMPGALGSSWTDFRPQIEKLPAILPDYTVIAWDPPGYGKSFPPRRYFNLKVFHHDALCAVNLMRTLNRNHFSILGWSDGGITALIVAGSCQKIVDKLVIWGAGAYINADEVKSLENIRDVSKWSLRMRQPMENIYGAERFKELWSEWVDAMTKIHTQCDGDLCKKEVKLIKAPTLIVHGKKDPMIASEHIPYLRKNIPNNRYFEFPDGKHNIHLKYPDKFNNLVAKFLLE